MRASRMMRSASSRLSSGAALMKCVRMCAPTSSPASAPAFECGAIGAEALHATCRLKPLSDAIRRAPIRFRNES